MITPDLVQYMKNDLAAGKSRDQIQRDLLVAGGWQVSDIQEAFAAIDGQVAPVVSPVSSPAAPSTFSPYAAPSTATAPHVGRVSNKSRFSFLTFLIVLAFVAAIAYGAEKFYGPVINPKVAGVVAMNPFKKTAPDPAVTQANNVLLNQAPTSGIPIVSTSTAEVTAPAVATTTTSTVPTAAPAPGTCANNDMACLQKAAVTCAPASVNNTTTVSVLGQKITSTTAYSIAPDISGCILNISTQTPAAQGACTFTRRSDLAAVVKNWQANTYSTADFAKASCSGNYFN